MFGKKRHKKVTDRYTGTVDDLKEYLDEWAAKNLGNPKATLYIPEEIVKVYEIMLSYERKV